MNKKLMEKNGLTQTQFEASEETVTTADLVEAIEVLTNIVLGTEEEEA